MSRSRPGLTAALVALGAALVACSGGPERPDVLLVVIDTLRADGLSAYGNPRATSPHLDRLASEGVLFERAYAQAPNTGPSHASLFTGLHPWAHRVSNHAGQGAAAGLRDEFETLAEGFAAAGYQTAAITDGGILRPEWGLGQGFEVHLARFEGVERKVDRALGFLENRRDGRPLFLFLHTYEVHQPYVPPREWVERFDPEYDGILRAAEDEVRRLLAEQRSGPEVPDKPVGKQELMRDAAAFDRRDRDYLRTLYDAEVAYTDDQLQRLWAWLADTGALGRTWIAVTSDHGEEFGEHGGMGHHALHTEVLRVPLILRAPDGVELVLGAGPHRVAAPVALLDLYTTLLAAAGLEPGPHAAGIDLVAALRAGAFPQRSLYAQTADHFHAGDDPPPVRQSVRTLEHAYLRKLHRDRRTQLVYDLRDDPRERRPLRGTEEARDLAGELGRLLDVHLVQQNAVRRAILGLVPAPVRRAISADAQRELDALGYTGD